MSGVRLRTELRITGGELRGRRVPIPPGGLRPTSERARQAYFNIVADQVSGARFLDLFAGSGIFSFEALSRGAASATAIDASRQSAIAIRKTAETLGITVEVIVADVLKTLSAFSPAPAGEKVAEGRMRGPSPGASRHPLPHAGEGTDAFDLVYADPPYEFGRYDDLLSALDRLPFTAGAVVALEHRRKTSPFTVAPQRLAFWRRAEYGEVWITFFRS